MKRIYAAVVAAVVLFSAFNAIARPVSGATSITHFGTPSKETVDRIRPIAIAEFKVDLLLWLKEEMRVDIDTTNTIKKFALSKLTERCLKDAIERPSARGRVWTLTILTNDVAVRNAVNAHNDHYGKIATAQWDRHNTAIETDTAAAFAAAISSLAAANARILPANAGARIGNTQLDDIRARVQVFVDRLEIKANMAVIEGRPGSLPSKSPSATVAIAGKSITGFPVTVFTQNGRQLGRMVTDEKGELPLKNLKIPFVHNSSMMTVSPDARGFLQANDFIRFRDMGIRFTKGQELTFIYKVPTLTYTLDYKVSTKSNDIDIPATFKNAAHIHSFLKDTCNLQQASSAGRADMAIRINVEFSKKSFDDTEEDALIMKASTDIKGAGLQLDNSADFEKRYPFGIKPQMGEYIWEATRNVRSVIKGALHKIDSSGDAGGINN